MNILVTAGNTLVPIDRVRCLTNIFTGRTGAAIALHAHACGHTVSLLTSHAEAVADLEGQAPHPKDRWIVQRYRTFDELRAQMERAIRSGGPRELVRPFDAVIHCAAVSDFLAAGIYGPARNTRFRVEDGSWQGLDQLPPGLEKRTAGKVKSDEPELWIRLVPAPKLIDLIRTDWEFRGVLVKFKLEVGVSDEELVDIAEHSRRHSAADLMVANTLERPAVGASYWAFLGPLEGGYQRISRRDLAARLLDAVAHVHEGRSHG